MFTDCLWTERHGAMRKHLLLKVLQRNSFRQCQLFLSPQWQNLLEKPLHRLEITGLSEDMIVLFTSILHAQTATWFSLYCWLVTNKNRCIGSCEVLHYYVPQINHISSFTTKTNKWNGCSPKFKTSKLHILKINTYNNIYKHDIVGLIHNDGKGQL